MPRTPAKFTQADLARALRAVDQVGVDMEVVLEPDGRIRLRRAQDEKPTRAEVFLTAPDEIVL